MKRTIICGLMILTFCLNVSAAVFTEKSGNGPGGSVYAAGNPDLYPIEYYDGKSKCYKGVIPDILKAVSEDTGMDFTYIYAGCGNRQSELAQNKQVEIVTAVSIDKEYDLIEKIPVISYETSGKLRTYCIGFTKSTDNDTAEKIKTALSNITESQKTGFLISNTEKPHSGHKNILIAVTAFVCVILAAISVEYVRRKKKTAFNQKDYTDKLTGIGNADYYIYVFDNLISEQSKNLYALAYLAFDCEKAEKQWGKGAVSEIEKYTAVKLNTYVGAAEYVSRVQKGVFAFLFQSENAENCLERTKRAADGINRYLSEFNSDWQNLFKAGICRLCEHKGANSETIFYNAKQGYLHAVSNGLVCHIGSAAQLAQNRRTDELRSSINNAVQNGDFKIYMQFITNGKSGEVCGAEVLSRWQNGKYGLLRPYEYIEILKETEKIVDHDYNVFEQVCRILEQWNAPPFDNIFLTCNFTRLSMGKDDFSEKLNEISQKYNFSHERLVIEITEDSLHSASGSLSKNIAKCSALGFKIAIDDMGTGFSSLADIYDNEID